MIKKIVAVIFVFVLLISAHSVFAAEKIDMYLYWAKGCPHCEKERIFLADLLKKDKYRDAVVLKDYEVVNHPRNLKIMQKHLAKMGRQAKGVPVTIIGNNIIEGFATADTTGVKIKQMIDNHLSSEEKEEKRTISLPVFGEIHLKNISLPMLTVVIGLLDGFNPCAMWTLLFLISMLLNMKNRKRMWALGSIFIATSAIIYFIFMAAWLNFILFIGVVFWVRILIGIFALSGGGWNLKKYFTRKRDSGCEIIDTSNRRKTLDRIKKIAFKKNFLLAIVGIMFLAISVNLVELICSAGLPAMYTQILAMNHLPVWEYYGYLVLYIFFFMLDDMIVFFIAMITLRATGISTKYSKWSSLIGGIIMLIIGILIIFKPGWLMFG